MAIDNQDVRWFVALGVLMLLVFAYIYMPRYDVRTLGDASSVSIVVIDRWTGRIQHAATTTPASCTSATSTCRFEW